MYLDFVFAYTEPVYIPVNKPSSTAIKTICASGCDYATLKEADAAAKPGWLIKIKAGTYLPTKWSSSGTSGNEIVIEPFGDGEVIVDINGTNRFYVGGSHIIFDGGVKRHLIFDGTDMAANQSIFCPVANSNNLTLSRVIVRNGGAGGSRGGSSINIMAYGDFMKIYNCEVYSSCSIGIYGVCGDYHEIKNNKIYNNEGSGIQYNPHKGAHSVNEVIISGNVIYGNGFTGAMGIRPGITLLSPTNKLYTAHVYNNLIWGNKTFGIQASGRTNAIINVYNNTVYDNIDAGVRFNISAGSKLRIKNNIVYKNGKSNWSAGAKYVSPGMHVRSNNVLDNPFFKSTVQSSSDFLKLSANSINCIDQGVDSPSSNLNVDYFGNTRSGICDIGAHEYVDTDATTDYFDNTRSGTGNIRTRKHMDVDAEAVPDTTAPAPPQGLRSW